MVGRTVARLIALMRPDRGATGVGVGGEGCEAASGWVQGLT